MKVKSTYAKYTLCVVTLRLYLRYKYYKVVSHFSGNSGGRCPENRALFLGIPSPISIIVQQNIFQAASVEFGESTETAANNDLLLLLSLNVVSSLHRCSICPDQLRAYSSLYQISLVSLPQSVVWYCVSNISAWFAFQVDSLSISAKQIIHKQVLYQLKVTLLHVFCYLRNTYRLSIVIALLTLTWKLLPCYEITCVDMFLISCDGSCIFHNLFSVA